MKQKTPMNLSALTKQGLSVLQHIRRYAGIGLLLIVVVLYAFLFWQVISLGNIQPSDSAVSSEVHSANLPHFDPIAVSQLESLQNNSVTVKALFNQARSNPFQE